MKIATLPLGQMGTNCYVVSDETNTCAVIDCDGNGLDLIKYLEDHQLTPTHILLTHGHFDHIGAVKTMKEKYGCPIYAGAKETPVLSDPNINFSIQVGAPITITPDHLLQEGDVVTIGNMKFTVMETPGHTCGSISFIGEHVIFSGDTLFQGSCGRTDFPTGDYQAILHSLKRLRDLAGDYEVYSGHGPMTTMEIERKTNPFF